jgi:hypothetical protein
MTTRTRGDAAAKVDHYARLAAEAQAAADEAGWVPVVERLSAKAQMYATLASGYGALAGALPAVAGPVPMRPENIDRSRIRFAP